MIRMRSAITALLVFVTGSVLAAGPSFVSYGKAWFEGQRGKFGYVDYWVGADFDHGTVYLSKFVFKDSNSVGGAKINRFVGSQWRTVVSSPGVRLIGLQMVGTWNGMPALGWFWVRDARDRDRIEFRVSGLFGTPIYCLSGNVVSGDCKTSLSP